MANFRAFLPLAAFALLCTLSKTAKVPMNPAASPVRDPNEKKFHGSENRLRAGFIECPCSVSWRGFAEIVLPDAREKLLTIAAAVGGTDPNGKFAAEDTRKIYDDCVRAHGHEACVNWGSANIFMGGASICKSDKKTGRNVVSDGPEDFKTVGACDLREDTKSPQTSLGKLMTRSGKGGKMSQKYAALPAKSPNASPDSWFEGCVAVEHLRGANLQHARHLRRRVLCAHGFCATPNHALLINSRWSSMKAMCGKRGQWNCTRSVKLVNNLSVAYHYRWRYNKSIVITPYDARFPMILMWFAQIIEDLFYFAGVAFVFAMLSSIATAIAAALVYVFQIDDCSQATILITNDPNRNKIK